MSPMWRAPIPSTRNRVAAPTRSIVSGTPSSLLSEPIVAIVGAALESTAVTRSLVLVLPWEPVSPATASPLRSQATTWAASACSAAWASLTTTVGRPITAVRSWRGWRQPPAKPFAQPLAVARGELASLHDPCDTRWTMNRVAVVADVADSSRVERDEARDAPPRRCAHGRTARSFGRAARSSAQWRPTS